MTQLLVSRPLVPGRSEQAAMEAALDGLAPTITPRSALLVLTEDAGSATARTFYADALATGPALASPAAFPWCLANAPCATMARRFGITGPNVTWLVDDLDSADGYGPAAAWLDGATDPALIAAIRFSGPAPRLAVWEWSPDGTPPNGRQMRADWGTVASPAPA